jgi:D-3-phosphoglycerate dehydrogenase
MAEKLGSFVAQIVDDANLEEITIRYGGKVAEWKTALIRNAAIKGILNQRLSEKANLVNAASVAAERGIRVVEAKEPGSDTSLLTIVLKTTSGDTELRGTVLHGNSHRMVMIGGINIEAPLHENLVYLRNRDVPGVIGEVGTIMGKHGVNIASFSLGRGEKKGDAVEAIAVVQVDSEVPAAAIEELKKVKAVTEVRKVKL